MTTCIYDTNGMQLCCCIGMAAALAYLELFQLKQHQVILETMPITDDVITAWAAVESH